MGSIRIPIALRWADLDAYGHVNNVAVLRILEEARARGFWQPGVGPLPPLRPTESIQAVVAELSVRYRSPLDYGTEPVIVEMTIERVAGASFLIRYDLKAGPDEHLFVSATSLIALVDAGTGAPRRIDPELRAALSAFGPP